jgi:hypothetical protein
MQGVRSAITTVMTSFVQLSKASCRRWTKAIALTLTLSINIQAHGDGSETPTCLYSSHKDVEPETNIQPVDCNDDPMHLREQQEIRIAIDALEISAVPFTFKGCRKAPFQVSPDTLVGTEYVVYYELTNASSTADYLAPVIHELSHVFQLKLAGGMNALTTKYSRDRIELEADFLTGIVLANYLRDVPTAAFQSNLNLVGRYRETKPQYGTPERRVAAFRRGLFFPDAKKGMTVAHLKFQGDIFGEISHF